MSIYLHLDETSFAKHTSKDRRLAPIGADPALLLATRRLKWQPDKVGAPSLAFASLRQQALQIINGRLEARALLQDAAHASAASAHAPNASSPSRAAAHHASTAAAQPPAAAGGFIAAPAPPPGAHNRAAATTAALDSTGGRLDTERSPSRNPSRNLSRWSPRSNEAARRSSMAAAAGGAAVEQRTDYRRPPRAVRSAVLASNLKHPPPREAGGGGESAYQKATVDRGGERRYRSEDPMRMARAPQPHQSAPHGLRDHARSAAPPAVTNRFVASGTWTDAPAPQGPLIAGGEVAARTRSGPLVAAALLDAAHHHPGRSSAAPPWHSPSARSLQHRQLSRLAAPATSTSFAFGQGSLLLQRGDPQQQELGSRSPLRPRSGSRTFGDQAAIAIEPLLPRARTLPPPPPADAARLDLQQSLTSTVRLLPPPAPPRTHAPVQLAAVLRRSSASPRQCSRSAAQICVAGDLSSSTCCTKAVAGRMQALALAFIYVSQLLPPAEIAGIQIATSLHFTAAEAKQTSGLTHSLDDLTFKFRSMLVIALHTQPSSVLAILASPV